MTRLETLRSDIASRRRKASLKAADDALRVCAIVAAFMVAAFIIKTFG